MITLDELAREIARHWDGESTARVLVREYGKEKEFPMWMVYGDWTIAESDIDELIELVTEELYGEDCDPVAISNIGKRRVAWT